MFKIITMKKFIKLKNWLSHNLPTYAADAQKHFFVLYVLSIPITIMGAFLPLYGLIGLGVLMGVAIIWEVLGFVENGVNDHTVKLAKADLAIAFTALFLQFAVLLILYTK